MTKQIKHENGHVQFRVLREKRIGQNSLQLSERTYRFDKKTDRGRAFMLLKATLERHSC